ncbi:hypothetical protein ACWEWX_13615 [Streptomyces asiaticus]
MTVMEAEVVAGWNAGLAGLGGAVVGAAGALAGGWLQQRQQEKAAIKERRETYGRDAAKAALTEFMQLDYELSDYIVGTVTPEEYWLHDALQKIRAAEVAGLQVPSGDGLRERLDSVFDTSRKYYMTGWNPVTQQTWFSSMTREAIELLAAFLRGDALPPVSDIFKQALDIANENSARDPQ